MQTPRGAGWQHSETGELGTGSRECPGLSPVGGSCHAASKGSAAACPTRLFPSGVTARCGCLSWTSNRSVDTLVILGTAVANQTHVLGGSDPRGFPCAIPIPHVAASSGSEPESSCSAPCPPLAVPAAVGVPWVKTCFLPVQHPSSDSWQQHLEFPLGNSPLLPSVHGVWQAEPPCAIRLDSDAAV